MTGVGMSAETDMDAEAGLAGTVGVRPPTWPRPEMVQVYPSRFAPRPRCASCMRANDPDAIPEMPPGMVVARFKLRLKAGKPMTDNPCTAMNSESTR